MKYTIDGKEYTEFDINKRCAELIGVLVESRCDRNGAYVITQDSRDYDPCNNPEDAWPIIEKCWDDLNRFVPNGITMVSKWRNIIEIHNCLKLVAACICFIELENGK